MQCPSFSNPLAPPERISFWQFDLVRRFDSVELHGRPRSRECDRRAFDLRRIRPLRLYAGLESTRLRTPVATGWPILLRLE